VRTIIAMAQSLNLDVIADARTALHGNGGRAWLYILLVINASDAVPSSPHPALS
jgi:hypothetical protein